MSQAMRCFSSCHRISSGEGKAYTIRTGHLSLGEGIANPDLSVAHAWRTSGEVTMVTSERTSVRANTKRIAGRRQSESLGGSGPGAYPCFDHPFATRGHA